MRFNVNDAEPLDGYFPVGPCSVSTAAVEFVQLSLFAGRAGAEPKYAGHGRNPYAVKLPAHGVSTARAGYGGGILPLNGSGHLSIL